ncbi:MAG: 4Fe-4S binding protein [Candidatus Lokiarchaeota archaeon]|nr:4Fe-4S binding protein [Candidatus Lokiarchaeota archaeon]
MNRKIIEIDEDLCTGCGQCVIGCAEGALEIINGKAKVVNEVFCDGLGACIGECPEGALEIIEREALEFDEEAVEKHLESLSQKEEAELNQVKQLVAEHAQECGCASGDFKITLDDHMCNCASTETTKFNESQKQTDITGKNSTELRQWPVQMHLINPAAPYFQGADVILTADCVAYALGEYHDKYLKGHSIAIACPKLDQGREIYIEKIRSWFDEAKINTLTVMRMQIPCCGGLLGLAQEAAKRASRKVPIKYIIVSVEGTIFKEEWL